jgi:hypothetical protein
MDTILDEFLMNAQAQGAVRGAQGTGHRVVGPQPAVRTNSAGEFRKVVPLCFSYLVKGVGAEKGPPLYERPHYRGRFRPSGLSARCHSLFDHNVRR